MQNLILSLSLVGTAALGVLAGGLNIDVTLPVECDRKTQKGDVIEVHYRGTLEATGNKFDASYDRGSPLAFQLGAGRVIQGWEEGLQDMCIGEKRTLTVPPEMGYGNRGMGPIPADSTLVFETELMGIKGVPQPESIVTKATSSASSTAADESSTGIAEKIVEKIEEAAEVAQTIITDTDDVQEHNEL